MPNLSAFRSFPYTAEVYNYRKQTGPDGGSTMIYSYLKDTKLDVNSGMFQKVTLVFPNDGEDIMPEAMLMKVKDKNGKELYPGGVWTLTGLVPILTIFGTREGFQGDARLTYEQIVT